MKKIVALALVMALMLGLVACGSTETTETTEDGLTGHIVFYTADPEAIATEVLDAFVAKNPGVDYELVRNGGAKLAAQLTEEMEAGGTDCNCMALADVSFINNWDEAGRIMHFKPDAYEDLACKDFGEIGFVYKEEVNVIAYNTVEYEKLGLEAPTDWDDLLDPKLNGRVAFPMPSYSGGAKMSVVVLGQYADVVGEDFYEKLAENNLQFQQANGGLKTTVSDGTYAAVCMIDYMARNAKDEGSPVEVVYPASGAINVPTPFMILSSVKDEDKAAVEAFANFQLSEEAQAIYAKYNYLPGVVGMDAPAGIDVSSINFLSFDMDYYVENAEALMEKYNAIFPEQ